MFSILEFITGSAVKRASESIVPRECFPLTPPLQYGTKAPVRGRPDGRVAPLIVGQAIEVVIPMHDEVRRGHLFLICEAYEMRIIIKKEMQKSYNLKMFPSSFAQSSRSGQEENIPVTISDHSENIVKLRAYSLS